MVLTLEPLSGVTEESRGFLDLRLDGQDLWVAGRVTELDGSRARFVVRGVPSARPPRQARLGSADVAVATFVPADSGLGRCFCPVLDLGRNAMRIASALPFPRGTILRDVVLVHRTRLLRRAEGTVLSLGEVIHHDGRKSWECAVRLRRAGETLIADDPADTIEIRDHARVCAVLWALCDLEYEVTIKTGTQRLPARLSAKRGPRDHLPEILCRVDDAEGEISGTVQLECALFGCGYRFLARAEPGPAPRLFLLTPAPTLRESHRRDEERFQFSPSAPATVELHHPLEGERQSYVLSDISASGFGMQLTRARAETLWPDLPLADVVLRLPTLTLRPPRAWVRTVEDGRSGVEMDGLSEEQLEQLRVELLRLSGHPASLHDGEDLDPIRAFHQRVGLLEPDMLRNLAATIDETRRTWRIAHQHPGGLMRTGIAHWRGEVGATSNVVRAYDSGWVLQHIAAAGPASLGLLYTMLFGLLTPRPDCEYLAGFVSDDFKSFHSNWATFAQAFSTPQFRGATPFILYAHDACSGAPRNARRLGPDEELLVQHAAQRLIDPVGARALGLRAGELAMPRTRAAFAEMGLERGREAWGVFRGDRCAALLVREWGSPGLSLSGLLSSGMLLPTSDDRDAARELCQLMATLPMPGDPPMRFLFVPTAVDQSVVEQAGYRRVGGCVLYACHRVGLREFLRFFAARYGFLQARISLKKPVAA
jgi:hypothetical protein